MAINLRWSFLGCLSESEAAICRWGGGGGGGAHRRDQSLRTAWSYLLRHKSEVMRSCQCGKWAVGCVPLVTPLTASSAVLQILLEEGAEANPRNMRARALHMADNICDH
jgi:hypothetical protein